MFAHVYQGLSGARARYGAVLALTGALLAAGCSLTPPSPSIPPEPRVVTELLRHDVSFVPGSANLAPSSEGELKTFLESIGRGPDDRVEVFAPAPATALTDRRRQVVASALLLNGVVVQPTTDEPAALTIEPEEVAVLIRRPTITVSACPDWTDRPNNNFWNQPGRNFGCSTAINLGMMVVSPQDLVRGRESGEADGTLSARSVSLYRAGKTKGLIRDAASAEVFPSSGGSE